MKVLDICETMFAVCELEVKEVCGYKIQLIEKSNAKTHEHSQFEVLCDGKPLNVIPFSTLGNVYMKAAETFETTCKTIEGLCFHQIFPKGDV